VLAVTVDAAGVFLWFSLLLVIIVFLLLYILATLHYDSYCVLCHISIVTHQLVVKKTKNPHTHFDSQLYGFAISFVDLF